jgi:proline dehydrogenase
MVALGARIRLVKGGYWESAEATYRDRGEVDQAFLRDLEFLLRQGNRPAIATHDPAAVARAVQVLDAEGKPKDAMEIQMLYGVRQDLAEDLVRRGYTVRCYVPYGAHWYEYVLGCIRRDPGRFLRSLRPGAMAVKGSRE